MNELQSWVHEILADPVTKQHASAASFKCVNGVIDARVFLKNTHGYGEWAHGQFEYEGDAAEGDSAESYKKEINYDRPIYERFKMQGRILDCGGGAGTVREFLSDAVDFVSIDPWLDAPLAPSSSKKESYACLKKPLNFIGATAEFLPFISGSFDWVHMRSMLDHVQVPDLALLEAKRVLKPSGRLLIGIYVEGGRLGRVTFGQRAKDFAKGCLGLFGIERWKDHHMWHPTYKGLLKLVEDNGFIVNDTYWQPHWNDTVCYLCASPSSFGPVSD